MASWYVINMLIFGCYYLLLPGFWCQLGEILFFVDSISIFGSHCIMPVQHCIHYLNVRVMKDSLFSELFCTGVLSLSRR